MRKVFPVLASCLLGLAVLAQARLVTSQGVVQGATEPVSPSVVATWTTVPGQQVVDVLVLWRGEPGWFNASPRRQSSADGANEFTSTSVFGSLSLNVRFDRVSRRGKINNALDFDLREQQIVLVDHVDTQPVLAGTLPLSGEIKDGLIASGIRQSDAAVKFLQCDMNSPAIANSPMWTKVCGRLK